ncbi:MAG: DUF3237 family protein [Spirochaetales bacterium]|nr:DUF3237 family protein [Spirochaetales bacterium]
MKIGIVICLVLLVGNGALFAASGDVNLDGALNIVDALLIAQYYVNLDPQNFHLSEADYNDDEVVNIVDALLIAQYYVDPDKPTPTPLETATPVVTPTPDQEVLMIVPHSSWNCGMSAGIPKPEDGQLVMELEIGLREVFDLGMTQYGLRKAFVGKSGTFTGSRINGTVSDGGLDFQLELSNGVLEIEQLFVLRASNGHIIFMRNAGVGPGFDDLRMVFDIEAPSNSTYNWLNSGKYVGRRVLNESGRSLKISIYDVTNITHPGGNVLTITKPQDKPAQPWDYRMANGESRGNQFIIEDVALGGSQSVGSTKNGRNRNIIPITGGAVSGNLSATIVSAGADYQNLGNPMTIDARYLWKTNDGVVIIVRNGGSFGSLVPTFEVKASSSYSYLNSRKYLSSDPGMSGNGVSITFYESR